MKDIRISRTAVRFRAVRGVCWDDLDMRAGTWIISANRMKMDREHRVPLSTAVVDPLNTLSHTEDSPSVFPATRGGAISDMTHSAGMKRVGAADLAADRAGLQIGLAGAPPCHMAFVARSVTRLQSEPTFPAKWRKLLWPTRLAIPLRQPIDEGTWSSGVQ